MIWHSVHFNKIAKMLREKREQTDDGTFSVLYQGARIQLLEELTLEFAEYFAEQNPNFDQERFLKACGYDAQ